MGGGQVAVLNRNSLKRVNLINDLKEMMELAKWTFGAKAFQAEGTARAKALRWECVCYVEGPWWGCDGPDWVKGI